ncbi:MAG: Ni/Fe hydrogenase subunit alpha [Henriciella sp.]|nr:Ni/Fe hydrogenase subunit alpha [Henriciella sp.]
MASKTIKVDYLARVEGEGALSLQIDGQTVTDAQLSIFEPPRFFEALLRGRDASEAPDITARICGICPVAYQMSAVHAIERAAGVRVTGPLRSLRRILYCGEWIESHALHIFMLHAPDFLGFDDAVAMAREHGELVQTGLNIKKAGNDIVETLGGRSVHPINVRLGGFYRVPTRHELLNLGERLKAARDEAYSIVRHLADFDFPDVERDYQFVALYHPEEYPMNEGRVVSNKGLDIDVADYEAHFEEEHRANSTALYAHLKGQGTYFVGPMARFNLNRKTLGPLVNECASEVGLSEGCNNPFKSILIRAIEVLYAFDEALRLIADYQEPDAPYIQVPLTSGEGCAVTEAPRGLLYHHYSLASDGTIETAKIVPPTSQNQSIMEEDLKTVAQASLELPDEDLTALCEQTIRNYDPCISCAAHFLTLKIDRGSEAAS